MVINWRVSNFNLIKMMMIIIILGERNFIHYLIFHSFIHSFIRWKRKQQGENFPGHKSNIDDDSFWKDFFFFSLFFQKTFFISGHHHHLIIIFQPRIILIDGFWADFCCCCYSGYCLRSIINEIRLDAIFAH